MGIPLDLPRCNLEQNVSSNTLWPRHRNDAGIKGLHIVLLREAKLYKANLFPKCVWCFTFSSQPVSLCVQLRVCVHPRMCMQAVDTYTLQVFSLLYLFNPLKAVLCAPEAPIEVRLGAEGAAGSAGHKAG